MTFRSKLGQNRLKIRISRNRSYCTSFESFQQADSKYEIKTNEIEIVKYLNEYFLNVKHEINIFLNKKLNFLNKLLKRFKTKYHIILFISYHEIMTLGSKLGQNRLKIGISRNRSYYTLF